jgi:hypothetical protein
MRALAVAVDGVDAVLAGGVPAGEENFEVDPTTKTENRCGPALALSANFSNFQSCARKRT